MSSLQIGRLVIGPPLTWQEAVGDPMTNLGGAPIPAPRQALRHMVALATFAADGAPDTVAARLVIRRQLRSLLNNTPLKLAGGLYIVYSDDPEQNGWYVPDTGQVADYDGSSGLATGLWKLDGVAWVMAGHQRISREARNIFMKLLTSGTYARDFLGWVLSTDFWQLPALSVTVLPNGSGNWVDTATGQVPHAVTLPQGRDGGRALITSGLQDLACISYERSEAALNLGDVIVYDRRGQITAPTTGPDTLWEEAYGPDYPWNWTEGGANDAPVLDNGLVRVRYDASVGDPGFRVDAWNGAAYVEQGKITIFRRGDNNGYCDTWISAVLCSPCTSDRATICVTFTSSPDWWSREQVFVTLQRGALGPTFECYPAPKNGGSLADCSIVWTVAAADVNDSVIKVDSQTLPSPIGVAVTAATAGSGSASWGAGGVLGASSFASSENWLAMLRCSALSTLTAFQTNFAVLQAAGAFAAYDGTDNSGYGVAQNVVYATSQGGAGYLRFDQRFISAASDQVHEAEDMRFVASGTTSQVADGTASGGQYVQDSQTSSVNYTIYKASTNLLGARYRVFARCKVGGGSSGGAFVPYINGTSTAGALTASTSWVWLDLGEVLAAAAGGFLAVAAWTPSGGWAAVDRVEVYLVEDRTSLAPIYGGARDLGASTLYDSRTFGALVAR